MRLKFIAIFLIVCQITACAPLAHQATPEEQLQYTHMIDQGTAELLLKHLDQAQAAFEVALQLNPGAESLDGLGCIAIERGDYFKAKEYFVKALDLNPDYTTALANLAALYHRVGDLENAQKLYKETLERDPGNYRARNNLGVILATRSKPHLAQKEIQRAQALFPTIITQGNLAVLSDNNAEN